MDDMIEAETGDEPEGAPEETRETFWGHLGDFVVGLLAAALP